MVVGRAWCLLLLCLLALVGAGGLAWRCARRALRAQVERERMRIAMELHDEMGSGLGSIGILAGVAASDEAGPTTQRELARLIARTAGTLGGALGDIVWSLDDGAARADLLVRRLTERARGLFPGRLALRLRLPARLAEITLAPAVGRAVQLVGQEALHNAARHAHAHRVELGVEPLEDRRCRVWVEDDGIGIHGTPPPGPRQRWGGGLGLSSMRRRAETIGAELHIGEGRGGRGTRVELVFEIDAEDRRVRARLPSSRWGARS
jgi:signal transduction histidine kinase